MARGGYTAQAIADEINRTRPAIYYRSRLMGVEVKPDYASKINHYRCKLTPEDVEDIRRLGAQNISYRDIQRQYYPSVSCHYIGLIIRGLRREKG